VLCFFSGLLEAAFAVLSAWLSDSLSYDDQSAWWQAFLALATALLLLATLCRSFARMVALPRAARRARRLFPQH